ncbi:MAG: DUF2520 domain-containing protein [Candidatus Berkiellales bacterium]
MRQVPYYLVIGSGRMATHICYYLTLLNLPFIQWSRNKNSFSELTSHLKDTTHILLLITDSNIHSFAQEMNIKPSQKLIHFSGQLSVEGIYSTHPLMTFNQDLYPLQTYQKIPFILENEGPILSELLPGLPNPWYLIPKELKTFYHALCVLSGNFSCILWQKFFNELVNTFQLPAEVGIPYLKQIFHNIMINPDTAVTGPLIRKDHATIDSHLKALQQDPFFKIYQSFSNTFLNLRKLNDEYY